MALLLSTAFIAVRYAMEPWLRGQAPLIVLLGAPIFSAWLGGFRAGVVSTVVCAIAGELLFVESRWVILPDSVGEWLRLGIFAVYGTVFSWLIATRRRALREITAEHGSLLEARGQLAERERRLREMLEASQRAEEALRESEQRAREAAHRAEAERAILDAILDSVPAGIMMTDPSGKLVRFNPANLQLWGRVPATPDVSGYATWKGWWADKSERHGRPIEAPDWSMARALRGEVVRGDVIEIEPFDRPGDRRSVVVSAAPVRDGGGSIDGAVVVQVDVTELVAAQEALRENAAMFQGLADNIAQLAWMTDATGYITWYNRRWFEYTGTTLEQMKGWGWQWAHHPDHVARVVAKFRRHIASGEPWEDTFPLRSSTGEYRWFLSRAFPLRDHAGRIVS
ncbi:MAG TPA: PAS domain S-box protein, partial [Ramlibacter sp.]|nr:PAS domain S-box protein [Ramlibacter sp.]